MCAAIRSSRAPDLFVMHYNKETWQVSDVLLMPHFAFSISAIEKRKPLSTTARRAGWVGCNILLGRIPTEAKIPIVIKGCETGISDVRQQYALLRPLETLTSGMRGWTLDVLAVVQSIGKKEFSLSEIYGLESSLGRLYPRNRHNREKIRQQLQVLRDLRLIEFIGRGRYRFRDSSSKN
jgi:type II restriction enzyme